MKSIRERIDKIDCDIKNLQEAHLSFQERHIRLQKKLLNLYKK